MDYFAALNAFVEAVDGNNFSRAAERLGIKASTVSRYIKDLENELGIALFNRSTRTLHLTEGGRTFLLHARRALEELAQAKAAAAALNQHPRGLLRLNLPPAFARHHILPALGAFRQRFSDIELELTLDDSQVDLIHSGTDLAIRVGQLADSTLKARIIAPETHLLVVSAGFAETHSEPCEPAELEKLPAIVGLGSRASVMYTLGQQTRAVLPSNTIRINDLEAQLLAVHHGLGYGVLPDWLVAEDLACGKLIRWLEPWHLKPFAQASSVWFIYPPKRIVSTKVRSFIDFMIERFGVKPYWTQ